MRILSSLGGTIDCRAPELDIAAGDALNAVRLANRCEDQLDYAIGVAEPVPVLVDTFGTGTIGEDELTERVRKTFDLTPKGIIETLQLRRPIFKQTAAYGHFGRETQDFTWEKTDKAAALKAGVSELPTPK